MPAKTEAQINVRVHCSDRTRFVLPVDAKDLPFEDLVKKIVNEHLEQSKLWDSKAQSAEVALVKNFHGFNLRGEKANLQMISSMDPNPSFPTVGVLFKRDLKGLAEQHQLSVSDFVKMVDFDGSSGFMLGDGPGMDTSHDRSLLSTSTSIDAPAPSASAKKERVPASAKRAAVVAQGFASLPAAVRTRLDAVFASGKCSLDDLEIYQFNSLGALPESSALKAIDEMAAENITGTAKGLLNAKIRKAQLELKKRKSLADSAPTAILQSAGRTLVCVFLYRVCPGVMWSCGVARWGGSGGSRGRAVREEEEEEKQGREGGGGGEERGGGRSQEGR
eukprot:3828674-Rhodomonas_salina.1